MRFLPRLHAAEDLELASYVGAAQKPGTLERDLGTDIWMIIITLILITITITILILTKLVNMYNALRVNIIYTR